MKKVLLFAAALLITGSMSQVLAGSACCPASKAKTVAKAECGTECMDGLNLTAEQQEKMAALKADCAGTECDVTSAKKMKSGVMEILTADQLATLKAKCDEKGCGMSAKADTADTGNQS
jgi:hypothetical protein